jgi:thiamine kinase-like enzyme
MSEGYVQDVSDIAMVFDARAREILREYYARVGSRPYQERHEKKEQWKAAQDECWRLWMREQERVLREVRERDGVQ